MHGIHALADHELRRLHLIAVERGAYKTAWAIHAERQRRLLEERRAA